MSDHEFEKRVKQKMDELRFSPSDAVWSGVQREIGKGRPNRRGWLWIPAMIAVVCVTGYFFMNNDASDKTLFSNTTETDQPATNGQPATNDQPATNGQIESNGAVAGNGDQIINGEQAPNDIKASDDTKSITGAQATNGADEQELSATAPKVGSTLTEKPVTQPGKAVTNPFESDQQAKISQTVPGKDGKKDAPAVTNQPAAQKEEGTVPGSRNTDLADLSISEPSRRAAKKTALDSRLHPAGNNRLSGKTGNNKSVVSNQDSENLFSPKQKSGKKETHKTDAASKHADSGNGAEDLAVADAKDVITANDSATIVRDAALASTNSAGVEPVIASAKDDSAKGASAKDALAKDASLKDASLKDAATKDSLAKDISANDAVAKDPSKKTLAKNALAKSNTTKSAASKNWSWGVSASAGVAKLADGKITDAFKSSENFDAALATQAPSNNSFMFRPVTAGVPPPKPSRVKPGAYFSVGGFVKKQISKRFAVSAGLQYTQHNHLIHTGNRVDSSQLVNNGAQVMNVARYYRADETSKFSNKYHLIELPITLHMQLNKSERFPLIWNLGASVGQLVASNALVFDSGTGVYYKDKSKYNNTQFTMSTGFSFGVFSRSATPLWIGPSVRYNNSRLFITEMKDEKHLFSASLDLRLFLNKK